MKKIFAICASALAILASASIANAQSIVTTRGTYPARTNPFMDMAKELCPADQEFEPGNVYDKLSSGVKAGAAKEFADLSELLAAFPTLPSAKQMICSKEECAKEMEAFITAVDEFCGEQRLAISTLSSAASKRPAAAASVQTSIPPELMALAGKDPEKMSEEELIAIAMKMANARQANGQSAAYAAIDRSDEDEEAIDEISDKIYEATDKASTAMASYGYGYGPLKLQKPLNALFNEIVAAWPESSECAQVAAIEKDIDAKTLKYWADNNISTYGNMKVTFPQSWYEGRKQENEIISGYNMPVAIKWRKTVQGAFDTAMPLLSEMAELDAELEKLFTDKSDSIYTMLKKQLVLSYSQLLPFFTAALTTVLDCPLTEFASETPNISQ